MNSNRILKQFEKIYNETYKNTLTYICSKCSNINDIDDILQETYIEVYKQLKKKKKVINYKSYIIVIAKNKINQYFNESQKSKNISIFNLGKGVLLLIFICDIYSLTHSSLKISCVKEFLMYIPL